MDGLVPPSSVHEISKTGATSTSSFRLLRFNSHASTPNFDRALSRWCSQILKLFTNPCTTR